MSLEPTLSFEDLNFLTPQDISECNLIQQQQLKQQEVADATTSNSSKSPISSFQPQYFISSASDKKINDTNNSNSTANTPKHLTTSTYQNIPPSTIIKVNKQQSKQSATTSEIECPIWASDPNPTRNDHLRFIKGGDSNHSVIISLEESKIVVFGRSNSVCDYVFSNPTVSRKHCFIAHDFEGRIQVVDLGSSHGTFINKQRAIPNRPYILKHGDKLYLGNDSSCMVAWKSSQNRQLAESLICKRAELQNMMKLDEKIDSATLAEREESLNDQILEFYTTINKTLLSNDNSFEEIDSLQNHLSQLTPPSPPSKKGREKLAGSKRRGEQQDSQSKAVRFSETANKFVYSEEDQVDQSYPTIQTHTVQFQLSNSSPSKRLFSPLKKSPITITTVSNFFNPTEDNEASEGEESIDRDQSSMTNSTNLFDSFNFIGKLQVTSTTSTTTTSATSTTSTTTNDINQQNNDNNNNNNNNTTVNERNDNHVNITKTNYNNNNNNNDDYTISENEEDEDDDSISIFSFSSPKKRFKINNSGGAGSNNESSDDSGSQTMIQQICT